MAQVAGIPLRVHVTLLAFMVFVAVSASYAGSSAVAAVGLLVAVFVCVAAHELAHSLVARSKGITVREIDLAPFGGVAVLERIPADGEVAIALAGPFFSIALAMALVLVAAIVRQPVSRTPVARGPFLAQVAVFNVRLAVFNMLPAFPLDGGRVLRSVLERGRSREDATRMAVRIGRVLAVIMIAIGFLGNAWYTIFGLYALIAGRLEEVAMRRHAVLAATPASAIALACPIALPSDMAAWEAAEVDDGQVAYPVTGPEGRILGVVTSEALFWSAQDETVGDVASRTMVKDRTSLEKIEALVHGGPVAVMHGKSMIGVITADILEEHLRQALKGPSHTTRHA